MKPLNNQIDDTVTAIQEHAGTRGTVLAEQSLAGTYELGLWLHYLQANNHAICANELLSGAYAAIVEASGYISIGLGRAAIMAIRAQIDLILAYTYFCDHPREWERVEQTGDGFKLRSEIYKYHQEVIKGFKARIGLIDQVSRPTLEDVYRILSAHIHGQSSYTIPKFGQIEELVMPQPFIESLVELQRMTSTAVSNYLGALYADNWPALPTPVVVRLRNTLSPAQRPLFFSASGQSDK